MKFIYILLFSTIILTSCKDNEYNIVGGNTQYPMFYVKTNIEDPNYNIYEYDSIRFEYPDYFDVQELISKDLILIEGSLKTLGFQEIIPKPKIIINPNNKRELLILGLEPLSNKTGWYSINQYQLYRIRFNYKAMGEQYWDFGYIFNIRDSRVD